MDKFVVVGTFKKIKKDQEGETQDCKNYKDALKLKEEWKRSNKYKEIFILNKDKI